jgi:DNA-binding GntR family transcriptional regulator
MKHISVTTGRIRKTMIRKTMGRKASRPALQNTAADITRKTVGKAARKTSSGPRKSAKQPRAAAGIPLKEHAYQLIKHRIITCAFKPGENLNEAAVAEMLNLGRTPVNQAFDRLRLEALVDVMPRKGIVVRNINFDEVLQISEARTLNEAHVVRLAAERATTGEMSAMRDILAEAERARDDLEQFILLDREFHMRIADAAKNEVFSDILLNLNERLLRLWSISLADETHKTNVRAEHHGIFMAICRRAPNEAEEAMRLHIDSFRQTVLKRLSDLQSPKIV